MNIELKHGKYKKIEPTIKVIEAIIRNKIPTTMHGDEDNIERFLEAAQCYREAISA